jgi:NAD(P)H-dependent FMN reductase
VCIADVSDPEAVERIANTALEADAVLFACTPRRQL